MWALRAPPPLKRNSHTAMESLYQLLKDHASKGSTQMSKYGHREKLILSYILASSLLYLYPGSWFQEIWNSEKVFFPERPNQRELSILTMPYLAVDIQLPATVIKERPVWQYHSHPAIQALGIMLLEIATETKFSAFCGDIRFGEEPGARRNLEGLRALQVLNEWESEGRRDESKRISSALRSAIRSCLVLDPPGQLPTQQLVEEGPIRYYVLVCIVSPLAKALSAGYQVPLKYLQDHSMLERYLKSSNISYETCISEHQAQAPVKPLDAADRDGMCRIKQT